ncbi:MAG: hypothetical protein ILP18_04205, partial [Treponema sp.]|nr:hypothetical protein [Treponema sp.]
MNDRINFGRLKDVLPIPDLIEIQTKSFKDFLQDDVPPEKRECKGFQEVFKEIFSPDWNDNSPSLEFIGYDLEEPKTPLVDCLKDGGTYQAPLYASFRLRVPGQKDTKEERVHIGEMPIMSERGSFVINGAERVIVSQLHRSPGVCFEKTKHASGKDLFSYKIVADHGSWLEVQYDNNGLIWIYLDRKRRRRKFLISTFLRAFGFESDRDLLDAVYRFFYLRSNSRRVARDKYDRMRLQPMFSNPPSQPTDYENGVFGSDEEKKDSLPRWQGVKEVEVAELLSIDNNALAHIYTAEPVLDPSDPKTKIIEGLNSLSERALLDARDAGVETIAAVDTTGLGDTFINCIIKEHREPMNIFTPDDARKDIYRKLRPQDTPTEATAKALFSRQFEDVRRYDLGRVGRYRIFKRLFHSPLADMDYMVSDDEKTFREKNGKVKFEEVRKALVLFQELLGEFNGDLEKLDEDEHVLRMLFSTSELAVSDLFRPCENPLADIAQARPVLSSFVKGAYRGFLASVDPEMVVDNPGGVIGEFFETYQSDALDCMRKACAKVGVGQEKGEGKGVK